MHRGRGDAEQSIAQSGRADSSVGHVALSMATGVFSGPCQFFLAGTSHHELIVAGPAATATIRLEDAAQAGEILVSPATAAALGNGWVDRERDGAFLLLDDFAGHAAAVATVSDAPPRADLEQFVPEPLREALGGRRRRGRAPPGGDGVREVLGRRRVARGRGPGGSRRSESTAFAQAVGEAADDNGVTWLESDIDVDGGKAYLIAGIADERRLRRGADAAHGAPDPGFRLRSHAPRRDQPRQGLRGRDRRAHPPHLRRPRRHGQPRRAPDRTRAARPDPLHRGRPRPFRGPLRVGGAAVPRQGEGARGDRLQRRGVDRPPRGTGSAAAAADRPRCGARTGAARRSNAARLRQQRLVEVVGEPGIGKSRLLEELVGQAVGFAQFLARCESHATAAPYFVFRPDPPPARRASSPARAPRRRAPSSAVGPARSCPTRRRGCRSSPYRSTRRCRPRRRSTQSGRRSAAGACTRSSSSS